MQLTLPLRHEYQRLFESCVVARREVGALPDIDFTVSRLGQHKSRYQSVGDRLGVPWHLVAVLHYAESALRFDGHLHNGDPLEGRTVHKPKGHPRTGSPPFTWEESAADALMLERLDQWNDWSVPGALYVLERYNGWGYRLYHPEVLSPYLWSGSNHYSRGRYQADGVWSGTAVARRYGAAVLLRRMCQSGMIQICARASFF